MKYSKEFIIGLVVLIAICLGIYGVSYLKGTDLFSSQNVYYAVYKNIDGLEKGNPITLNGYKVGAIKNIQINPKNQKQLLVSLVVNEKELRIPKDSKAIIISSDILGSKAVDLYLGSADTLLFPGDTIYSEVEAGLKESVNKELAPLKNKAENLLSSVDEAIQVVNAVFDKDAKRDLNQGLTDLKNTLSTLKNSAVNVDQIIQRQRETIEISMENLKVFTEMLKNNSEELQATITNFRIISDSLADSDIKGAIDNAEKAMADISNIMQKVNDGGGTLGKLINDDSLFVSMLEATQNLEYLLEDMRVHPNRYVHLSVFGVREKGTVLTREQEKKIEKLLKEK